MENIFLGWKKRIDILSVIDTLISMKRASVLAIKTILNQIILIGYPMDNLQHNVKCNPLSTIVRKTKKGWVTHERSN